MRQELRGIFDDTLFQFRAVVFDQLYDRFPPDNFFLKPQRARRFAGNGFTQSEHPLGERLRGHRIHRHIFSAAQFHYPEAGDRQQVAD